MESGLPWGRDPDPGLCPLITGFQLARGSCLPGSQEVLGGQRYFGVMLEHVCVLKAPEAMLRTPVEIHELAAVLLNLGCTLGCFEPTDTLSHHQDLI